MDVYAVFVPGLNQKADGFAEAVKFKKSKGLQSRFGVRARLRSSASSSPEGPGWSQSARPLCMRMQLPTVTSAAHSWSRAELVNRPTQVRLAPRPCA